MNSLISGTKVSLAITGVAAWGLIISPSATAASLYSITDLGLGVANDINDRGQVVGTSSGSAFIWSQNTGKKDLGTFGGSYSVANSINNLGQVVGGVDVSNGSVAFFWSENHVVNDLRTDVPPDIDFREDWALAINDSGTVLATVYSGAFFWSESRGISSLAMGGFARNLNNLGQVVGSINDRGTHSFVWDESDRIIEFQPVGAVYAVYSTATAINDLGQVTGHSYFEDDSIRAYFWTKSTGIADLGTLGDSYTDTFAEDINNLGQIVGYSRMSLDIPSRAFIWENGVMNDLNNLLVDGSGWLLSEAQAINEKGQIVGNGVFNGETRAFLLTPTSSSEPEPVPEPSSILGVLAFGAVGAGSLLQRSKTTMRSKF